MNSVTPIVPYMLTTYLAEDGLFKIWGIKDRERYECINKILFLHNDRLAPNTFIPQTTELMPGKLVLVRYNNALVRGAITSIDTSSPATFRVHLLDVGSTITVPLHDLRSSEITHLRSIDNAPCAEEYILCDVLMKQKPWTSDDHVWAQYFLNSHSDVKVVCVVAGKPLVSCPILDPSNKLISFGECLEDRGLAQRVHVDQVKYMVFAKYGPKTPPNQLTGPPPGLGNVSNLLRHPYPSYPVQPEPMIMPTMSTQSYPPPSMHGGLQPSAMQRIVPPPTEEIRVPPTHFRMDTLPVNTQHEVIVSSITDGMLSFCIQLKHNMDQKLATLMARINDIQPKPIDKQPVTGMMCLGKYGEDKTLCRAVVSTVLSDGCNLYFVDFGCSQIVPFHEMFKLPPEFTEENMMSIPFTLANLSTNSALGTQEARKIFEELVQKVDQLVMVVTKPEIAIKQYCELFIRENGNLINIKQKVLDKVKLMKPAEYQKIPFKPNSSASVLVSFAESAFKFYVQLEVNQPLLDILMMSVEDYCLKAENKDLLYVEDVNVNMAVCAQYTEDQKWYRGLIAEEPDADGMVAVFYVDYGNEEDVHYSDLRIMNNEMVSKFPMQAIECRLDIDSELALCVDVVREFIEMVDGNAFNMKVKSILPQNALLVELFDDKDQNVKNLLFEKLGLDETGAKITSPNTGNWRERNNSATDGDFSAFRREENQQRPRGKTSNESDERAKRPSEFKRQESRGFDEVDDAARSVNKTSDRWSQNEGSGSSFDRFNKRPSRDDWSNNSSNRRDDDRYGSKPSRDESRRFEKDDGWNRDREDGDRKPYRRQDDGDSRGSGGGGSRDGDAGERKPYRRRDDNDGWGSRDGDSGVKKPFNRDDRRGGGGGGYRKSDDDWNSNRDDDRDGQKPFYKRNDSGGSGSFGGEKNNDDWSNNKNDSWSNKKNDSDWSGRNDSDWKGRNNDSNWKSRNNDSDWKSRNNGSDWKGKNNDSDYNSQKNDDWGSGQKNDSEWGGKPKFSQDDRRPRRDGDYQPREGGGFNSRDNPRQREGGFGTRNSYKATPSLSDGYALGSQIPESDFSIGQQLEVAISWFINPAHFFLIQSDNADFRQLMENIQADYPQRKNADSNSLSSGDFVVTRDKDEVIYRAKVIQMRPGGATVSFVDYGNCESVGRAQIWTISGDHCLIPAQAICCGLHNISPASEAGQWNLPADLEKYFGKEKYTVTFVECREEGAFKTWLVNLIDENNVNIGDLLVADGLAIKNVVLKSEELYDIELLRDQILTVFPGHIESSKKFFVHIEPAKAEIIRESVDLLTKTPDLLIPLPTENLREGQFCLAPAGNDVYYRAQILSVDEAEKTAHIAYIDYGDENDVAFETMKVLPENLAVYNPQIVECFLHGGESFTNDEAFVDALNEIDFIIKVIAVVDNKLSVLVYDINGARLPYPVEVEEAVDTLCSLPMLKSLEKVNVTHVTSDKVYLSRTSDVDYILQLCEQLKVKYDTEELDKVTVEPGVYYAAKSKVFESWYRCILPSAESTDVLYIDYGNTEPVEDLLAVKLLDKDFFVSPMYCVAASTAFKFTNEDLTPLLELIPEVIFDAVFKKQSTGWYVDLKCEKTGKTLTDFATQCGCAYESNTNEANETEKPYVAFDGWQLDEEKNVAIAHVKSPNSFYLHLSSDVEKISAMQKSLQLSLKKLLPVVGPEEGVFAVPKSDGEWCRATRLNEQEAFAIDFGEIVPLSVIKKIPYSFAADQNKYVVECSLNIKPVAGEWGDEVKRFYKTVENGQQIVAKLEFLKNPKIIDLIVDGVSVSTTLVEENLAQWQGHEVIVCHVNSLTDFYIQELDRENELFEMGDKLKDAESWENVDPTLDDYVVAQFAEDSLWYRATVIRIEDGVKHVRFIDYGNESPCDQFRVLPESLKTLPKHAIKCSLPPGTENAEELGDKFINLVGSADGVFSAYFLSRGEPMLVALYYNDVSIEDALSEKPVDVVVAEVPATESEVPVDSVSYDNVTVCHINSPSSFYVQSETIPLDRVESALVGVDNTIPLTEPVVGSVIAAMFVDDGVWYRAKVTDIADDAVTVCFVDYGNCSVVQEMRPLPENAVGIPPLAKHCAFTLPTGLDQWPEIAKQRFAELTCDGMTSFKMNVREEGDPAFVDLQDDGVNVADELATLCKADLTTTTLLSQAIESKVLLSHVENLNEIWIQFQKPQLDEMADEMANAETFDALLTPEEGSLVAALFEDDGVWYRAKLLRLNDDQSYRVLFIDYGNASDVTSIKSLPADLVNLPALAKCCRLKNFIQVGKKHVNAIVTKLREMVEQAQSFTVRELIEEDDLNLVSLTFDDDKNLATELVNFYIQLTGPNAVPQFEDAVEVEETPATTDDEKVPETTAVENLVDIVQDVDTTEREKPNDEIQTEAVSVSEKPIDDFQSEAVAETKPVDEVPSEIVADNEKAVDSVESKDIELVYTTSVADSILPCNENTDSVAEKIDDIIEEAVIHVEETMSSQEPVKQVSESANHVEDNSVAKTEDLPEDITSVIVDDSDTTFIDSETDYFVSAVESIPEDTVSEKSDAADDSECKLFAENLPPLAEAEEFEYSEPGDSTVEVTVDSSAAGLKSDKANSSIKSLVPEHIQFADVDVSNDDDLIGESILDERDVTDDRDANLVSTAQVCESIHNQSTTPIIIPLPAKSEPEDAILVAETSDHTSARNDDTESTVSEQPLDLPSESVSCSARPVDLCEIPDTDEKTSSEFISSVPCTSVNENVTELPTSTISSVPHLTDVETDETAEKSSSEALIDTFTDVDSADVSKGEISAEISAERHEDVFPSSVESLHVPISDTPLISIDEIAEISSDLAPSVDEKSAEKHEDMYSSPVEFRPVSIFDSSPISSDKTAETSSDIAPSVDSNNDLVKIEISAEDAQIPLETASVAASSLLTDVGPGVENAEGKEKSALPSIEKSKIDDVPSLVEEVEPTPGESPTDVKSDEVPSDVVSLTDNEKKPFELQNTLAESDLSSDCSAPVAERHIAEEWFDQIVNSDFILEPALLFSQSNGDGDSYLSSSSSSWSESKEADDTTDLQRTIDVSSGSATEMNEGAPAECKSTVAAESVDTAVIALPVTDAGENDVADMQLLPKDDGKLDSSSSLDAEVERALAYAVPAFGRPDDAVKSPPTIRTPPIAAHLGRVVSPVQTPKESSEAVRRVKTLQLDELDESNSVYFDTYADPPRSAQLSDDDASPKAGAVSGDTTSDDDEVFSSETDDRPAAADLCCVTFVDGPGNFFVQRMTDVPKLQMLEEQLAEHRSEAVRPDELRADEPETTLYGAEIDGHLHRVRLLSREPEASSDDQSVYSVYRVDHGSTHKTSTLFRIPNAMRDVDPMALNCSLRLPCFLTTWPVDVCQEFERLVLAKGATFTLRIRKPSDSLTIVDLIKRGRSIAERMKTLCEEFGPNDTFDDSRDSSFEDTNE